MFVRSATWARRGAVLLLVGASALAALGGVGPGVGREATLGAASPLVWLPGYVPWPILLLAALGLVVLAWRSLPRALVPLLLVGGLPSLLYLPDPLVTGDHPWMVRRLVPAVIPLLALIASIGATTLWRLELRGHLTRLRELGPFAAAILTGLGLAVAVAHDGDLAGPRDAAGAVAGLRTLAANLPPDAVVVFPAGPAGIHLAMPLDWDFGVTTFAVTETTLTPGIGAVLARWEESGRPTYWAQEGAQPPVLPAGATATLVRTTHVHYESADSGPVPPPLQLTAIDDVVMLYRVSFASSP